jgi:Lrp/AsnC family leucine-responsive transcriptional regulator
MVDSANPGADPEPRMPSQRLDEIDRRIIEALQADGRITTQELADRVGLSPSPCARRVRLLEAAGIIKGYVALVDQAKVGLPINVFASIKLERQREEDLDRFAAAVARWPEVADCYLMTGPRDYLMRIILPDLGDYERFLKEKLTRLDNIASIESSFALGQVKQSYSVPMLPRGTGSAGAGAGATRPRSAR